MNSMEQLKKMLADKISSPVMQDFLDLYRRYKQGSAKIADWESIRSPSPGDLPRYDSLEAPDSSTLRKILGKLAVCKLNGGLGTSMGCSGPKSSVVVRDGYSFLDLIVEQLCQLDKENQASVPLVLMNSFYTHAETDIEKYKGRLHIETFQQNKFPRIRKDSELPLDEEKFGRDAWYPPGHGDFYSCIRQQGLLDKWLDQGREILFISNSDNLGATVDGRILSYMVESSCPFLMEVTEKTAADVKGGTLCREGDRLRLLEVAQVPPEHMDDFCGTHKFKIFNTNNLWINLAHLKKKLEEDSLKMEIIVNPKSVDGVEVVQLETAMGAGIGSFAGSVGLVVPRSRYLPVKRTNDLFLMQSDLFVLEEGRLRRNPARKLPGLPLIKFGKFYAKLEDYQKRIPSIPSLIELESLDLDGDIWFEEGVTLKGKVSLAHPQGRMTVPKRSVLENKET